VCRHARIDVDGRRLRGCLRPAAVLRATKRLQEAEAELPASERPLESADGRTAGTFKTEIVRLAKWEGVADADEKAAEVLRSARKSNRRWGTIVGLRSSLARIHCFSIPSSISGHKGCYKSELAMLAAWTNPKARPRNLP
jgi:hypothetical protein